MNQARFEGLHAAQWREFETWLDQLGGKPVDGARIARQWPHRYRALAHHLAVLQAKHSHGDVRAVLLEYAGHAQLLCDQTRTHRLYPFPLALDRVIS